MKLTRINKKRKEEKAFLKKYKIEFKSFCKIAKIMQERRDLKHKKGGRPNKLTVEDSLKMTLMKKTKEKITYVDLAEKYNISKSQSQEIVMETAELMNKLQTENKEYVDALKKIENEEIVFAVDTTLIEVEMPKLEQ
jgi:hypothetical protein